MKKLLPLILILFSILLSCSKDSKNTNETTIIPDDTLNTDGFLKIETGNNFIPNHYYYSDEKKWVVIYDLNWEVLNFALMENNSSYSFEDITQEVHIQTVYINYVYDDLNNADIRLYMNIKPETLRMGFGQENTRIGELKVNTVDFELDEFSIGSLGPVISVSANSYNSIELPQYFNPDKLLFVSSNYYPFKYVYLEDIGLNETIEIRESDLIEMNTQNILFPEYNSASVYVVADDLSTSNIGDFEFPGLQYQFYNSDNCVVYYPENLFDAFYTKFSCYSDNALEWYRYHGDIIPDAFKSLDNSVVITNDELDEFNCSIDGQSDYITLYWSNYLEATDQNIAYFIYSENSEEFSFIAPEIPEEIISYFPALNNFSDYSFKFLEFYEYSNVEDYEDYIEYILVENKSLMKDGEVMIKRIEAE